MSKTEGIPMSEEDLKDWQQAFKDIEESIEMVKGETDGRQQHIIQSDKNNVGGRTRKVK